MQSRFRLAVCLLLFSATCLTTSSSLRGDENRRRTALVSAVARCRDSVVNLRGRKTVSETSDDSVDSREIRHVNGMGTGVVIDPRGYILTNYHVVQDVREIKVTTSRNESTTGRLVAHDPETDLAILKINTREPLPVITIGTSSDLMLAETVAAVGNAYGYEHTVTVGIISQLGRTVQVNENQIYRNLIQTDASINPGNSGGPLLNLDGEMIGINVAVRVGAQGIAFAIPVNDALDIAARMIEDHIAREVSHGLVMQTIYLDHEPQLLVTQVESNSAAESAGLSKGDQVVAVNGQPVHRSIDFQCALLGNTGQTELPVTIRHGETEREISILLQRNGLQVNAAAWNALGVRLQPTTPEEMENRHPKYEKGLKVVGVRPGSPAEEAQIIEGDILVAMHGWKTESMDNLEYVLQLPDLQENRQFMFYILRDRDPFFGHMRIASASND